MSAIHYKRLSELAQKVRDLEKRVKELEKKSAYLTKEECAKLVEFQKGLL